MQHLPPAFLVVPALLLTCLCHGLFAAEPAVTAPSAVKPTPAVLTTGVAARVMCVGDSITLGKDTRSGGYRGVLYTWLAATGHPITYVGHGDDGDPANATATSSRMTTPTNHEGYGSFRIDMIQDGGTAERRTAPPLASSLAAYKPDIVLLMLGTNDIMQDWQLPTISQRMAKLVDTVLAADSHPTLLLASIAPISNAGPGLTYHPRPGKEEQVLVFNAAIRELVARHQALGHRIVFVDVHAALEKGGLDRGGVHPDSAGYDKVAAAWFQALTGQPAPSVATAK